MMSDILLCLAIVATAIQAAEYKITPHLYKDELYLDEVSDFSLKLDQTTHWALQVEPEKSEVSIENAFVQFIDRRGDGDTECDTFEYVPLVGYGDMSDLQQTFGAASNQVRFDIRITPALACAAMTKKRSEVVLTSTVMVDYLIAGMRRRRHSSGTIVSSMANVHRQRRVSTDETTVTAIVQITYTPQELTEALASEAQLKTSVAVMKGTAAVISMGKTVLIYTVGGLLLLLCCCFCCGACCGVCFSNIRNKRKAANSGQVVADSREMDSNLTMVRDEQSRMSFQSDSGANVINVNVKSAEDLPPGYSVEPTLKQENLENKRV
ncbi:hypothetical protein SARC_06317 [Sphaeroforma arctica JP610]|uniref:Uncharacterized protein n=1 Tax=Sphaeroforma arctica JP610 TaxID=667725 RepID=A0A0L0FWZ6_9EUKA|nr:hypothetical protein SARC_06317 [Sphaeroforma arctica JP610]KNC81357.1 hypothetical protein SARC_06317 [Sphaeroforma arctica JP610]|eukprot:XP_014155259.1 hypothetical protein SARC_06317 [Sphaeroforma arctica JP610]